MGYDEDDRAEMRKYADRQMRNKKEKQIWFLISVLYIFFLVVKYSIQVFERGGLNISAALDIFSSNILSIFFVLYAPGLFYQIFDIYPIEFFKIAIKTKDWPINTPNPNQIREQLPAANSGTNEYITQQAALVRESYIISEKIYSRAGAYLFLGCSIAFTGIAVFSTFLVDNTEKNTIEKRFDINALNAMSTLNTSRDTLSKPVVKALRQAIINQIMNNDSAQSKSDYVYFGVKVIDYLPRFGALLLVEFVAFFFLKQYRVMLEEYRYYESLKRKRQDDLSFALFLEFNKDNHELIKIFSQRFSDIVPHKLAKDETTQVLETQKILNQEMDLIGKLTDLIKSIRNSST